MRHTQRFLLKICMGLVVSLMLTGMLTQYSHAQPEENIPVESSGDVFSVPEQNAVIYWDNVALDAVRISLPGPPVVARALAMVHTAQYEAWSQYDGMAVGSLLGSMYRQPNTERTLEHKSEAMSYAAYRVLVDLFPDLKDLFDSYWENYGLTSEVTSMTPDTPAGVGNLAAAAVLAYRHDDGANQLGDRHPGAYTDYTGYQPVNTPDKVVDLNRWQPLATPNGSFQGGCLETGELTVQTYVGPHWGNVLPFALNDGEPIVLPIEPAVHPSPEFTQQAQEVVDLSANLSDRQKAIAEYWADGPASELPPGHWAMFGQVVSERDQHTLDDDAKLFFALSNANLDAGIYAWKVKRTYDSVRPITAIRELFRGQKIRSWAGPYEGTQWIDGSEWQPYQQLCFVSPAFPEFLSGHSTFSAASAQILKLFTGSDAFGYGETVYYSEVETFDEPIDLFWPTFSAAANEAGMSRRFGGIHFTRGDMAGRAVGRTIGNRVWNKTQAFFMGLATPVADLQTQLSAMVATDNFNQVFPVREAIQPNSELTYPDFYSGTHSG